MDAMADEALWKQGHLPDYIGHGRKEDGAMTQDQPVNKKDYNIIRIVPQKSNCYPRPYTSNVFTDPVDNSTTC